MAQQVPTTLKLYVVPLLHSSLLRSQRYITFWDIAPRHGLVCCEICTNIGATTKGASKMNKLFSVLYLLILGIFPIEGNNNVPTFQLSGSNSKSYSKFITSLRNHLPNDGNVFNIPLLLPQASGSQRYKTMQLSNYEGNAITVAIDVTNVYLMGYLVNTTSYFFNESDAQTASKFVFIGSKVTTLPYSGNYQRLQIAANKERDSIPLGFPALDSAISALYHYDSKAAAVAFLVIIQSTAEASRFKYIEKQIIERIHRNERPSLAMISLENEWSLLSKQIQIANTNNGRFQVPVKLYNDKGVMVEITNVTSPLVTNNIKLLLNQRNIAPN